MPTVYNDHDRIFRAMCASACGYLLKRTAPGELREAIQEIAQRRRGHVAGGSDARGRPVSQKRPCTKPHG
jgi:DNA-binding NarL/FixJ family response regulator